MIWRTIWWKAVAFAVLAVTFFMPLQGQEGKHELAAFASEGEAETAGPSYMGSTLCQACHGEVARAMATTGHGKVLSTDGSSAEPAGCEACHGPGSEHIGSTGTKPPGQTFEGAMPKQVEAVCGKCHLKEAGAISRLVGDLSARYWEKSGHGRDELSCLSCHRVHGGAEDALRKPAGELCLQCHEDALNEAGGYTHKPVAEGKCLLCHDPHGTGASQDLKPSIGDVCRSCHPVSSPGFSKAHGDYAMNESNCISCHSPHSFDRAGSLISKNQHTPFKARQCNLCHTGGADAQPGLAKPQKELCGRCHPGDQIMPAQDGEGKSTSHHVPVEQGLCTTCHNPHASEQTGYMRAKMDAVCFACHGETEKATGLEYGHAPVATGNCLLCHEGHTSAQKHLLNKSSIELCESCHATQGEFTHPVGIWKGKKITDPNSGDMLVCASCHGVHGSDTEGLLLAEETTLCRTCHGT